MILTETIIFLDNTKNTFTNLGNKIKGGNHKTKDEDFKKLEDSFFEQKKKIDSISKDVISFLSAIDALLQSQEKAAEHLRSLFPDESNTNVNNLVVAQLNVLDKVKEEKKEVGN